MKFSTSFTLALFVQLLSVFLIRASDLGAQQILDQEEVRQLSIPMSQPVLFRSQDLDIMKDSMYCSSITRTILSFVSFTVSVALMTDIGSFCLDEKPTDIVGFLVFMTILKTLKIAFGLISPKQDSSENQALLNNSDVVSSDANRSPKCVRIADILISIISGLLCLLTLFISPFCEGTSFSSQFSILIQLVLASNAVDFVYSGACMVNNNCH